MKLTFTVPLRIQSVANLREFWAKRYKRTKTERHAIMLGFIRTGAEGSAFRHGVAMRANPVSVTLTRVAPRPIKDTHDNLRSAFKSVVDEVAAQLGIDDGDERLRWEYAQERGAYAVRVEIVTAEREAA